MTFLEKYSEERDMWERFKFWMSGQKDCGGCCLGCSYFDECKADICEEASEVEMQEVYERDMVIEAIIKERMPEKYRKSA